MPLSDHGAAVMALSKCFGLDGDCTVVVGPTDGKQHMPPQGAQSTAEFRVWSKLLAAWSDVFAAMFSHEFVEKAQARIEIRDFSIPAVEAFLRFIYSGNLEAPLGVLLEVCALADKYDIKPLKVLCLKGIEQKLRADKACEFLEATLRMGNSDVQMKCTELIYKQPVAALKRGFLLNPAKLEEVLSSRRMHIGDFDLSMAFLDWGQNAAVNTTESEVRSLFEKHVQLNALTEDQCTTLRTRVKTCRRCGAVIESLLAKRIEGTPTECLFKTLWTMYSSQFPTEPRPLFVGHWINLLPSNPNFLTPTVANVSQMRMLERLLSSDVSPKLNEGDELVWMLPNHAIYLYGLAFSPCLLPGRLSVFIQCSPDGSSWDDLLDTDTIADTHVTYIGGWNAGLPVRCKRSSKWFKLRVKKGKYCHALHLKGILVG